MEKSGEIARPRASNSSRTPWRIRPMLKRVGSKEKQDACPEEPHHHPAPRGGVRLKSPKVSGGKKKGEYFKTDKKTIRLSPRTPSFLSGTSAIRHRLVTHGSAGQEEKRQPKNEGELSAIWWADGSVKKPALC